MSGAPSPATGPGRRDSSDALLCVALASLATLLLVAWLVTVDYRHLAETLSSLRRSRAAWWLLPYVTIVVLARLRLRRGAGGLAILTSTAAIVYVSARTQAREMALVAFALYGEILAFSLLALLLCQLALVAAGVALLRRRSVTAGRGLSVVLGVIITVSVLSIGRNTSLYLSSSQHHAGAIEAERVKGIDALRRMGRCLTAWAGANGGEYPAQLPLLGPQGTACLEPAVAEGRITGYTLSYSPGRDDLSGRLTSYSITLVAVDPERRSYDSYRTDESGVLYSGLGPDGKWGTPIQNQLMGIQTIENCAEQYRRRDPARSYPTRAQLLSDRCMRWGGSLRSDFDGLRSGVLDGYRYIYSEAAPDETGKIGSFRLDVRPVLYGHGFKTSYLCDPQGRLRATDDDRPAEHTDPNIEKDEALDDERPDNCVGQRRAP